MSPRITSDLQRIREDALFDGCPWRTVFVHPDFLAAWFAFRSAARPVLIRDDASLVPLAAEDGRLGFAGGGDVPVHGWLGRPLSGSFVLERALGRSPPTPLVAFTPPPGAPLDWLAPARSLGRLAHVTTERRRIFTCDPIRAAQPLADKKNTSQLHEVKALGPLALADARPEDLRTHLEWHRHKRHQRGLQPSLHRERADLYRRLGPAILSSTVLTAGGVVLSAMLIYRDGPRAWLELLAENPEHERHSPGLLHLFLLEQRWIGEVTEIDVTADDDWMHVLAEERPITRVELLFGRRARLRRRAAGAVARLFSPR